MRNLSTALVVLLLLWLQPPGSAWAQEDRPPAEEPAGTGDDPPPSPEELQAIAVEAFNEEYTAEKARLEKTGELSTATVLEEKAASMAGSRVQDAATASPLPNSASTSRDLISWLVGALDLGDLSEDGKNLVLALNPKFFDLGSGQGSGKVTLHAPDLFEAVAMKFPEDVRESRKQALVEGLDELDDAEVAITWSQEGNRIGRDPKDYFPLTSSLAGKISAQQETELEDEAFQTLLASLNQVADRETMERKGREAGIAAARSLAAFQKTLQESGFFKIGDLIGNQPQLYVDITGRFRDRLLGRDEYGVAATWEKGFANVNALLKQDCAPAATLSRQQRLEQVSESCFSQFLQDHAEEWSKRVKIKIEYSESDAYHLDLPDDDVTIDLDSAHTFRVTGGFGFDLAALPEVGNSPARVELEAKYEKVSDEEVRNDERLVATLSYIQKMSDSSSASLSLIYANKPELLGEVDQEVSAHVGLKLKMDTKAD